MAEKIQQLDGTIQVTQAKGAPVRDCLQSIPGYAPVVAAAMLAAAGSDHQLSNSGEFIAWLGLVPRQSSSGGDVRLLGITKNGDRYLRSLLITLGRCPCYSLPEPVEEENKSESKPVPCRWVGRNISAVHQFVPGSSQNRTWSVTPSGSQLESSTSARDRGRAQYAQLAAAVERPRRSASR